MRNKYVYIITSTFDEIIEDEYYDWEEFVNIINDIMDSDTNVKVYPFNDWSYKVHLHSISLGGKGQKASKGAVIFNLINGTNEKMANDLFFDIIGE